jgi:hypothetical protein
MARTASATARAGGTYRISLATQTSAGIRHVRHTLTKQVLCGRSFAGTNTSTVVLVGPLMPWRRAAASPVSTLCGPACSSAPISRWLVDTPPVTAT